MKEYIDKLAIGSVEYEHPILGVSISEIEFDIISESVFSGEFRIYSENDLPLKGIVYSSHEAVRIINPTFYGREMVIKYEISSAYVAKGECIKGVISLVSNGGEVDIPFNVNVDPLSVETSIGKVKNLFHFANLVQVSYDEALNLYKSARFEKIFIREDFYLQAVYEGLAGCSDIEQAMEEFLIAANKKTPVKFDIAEKKKEYNELTENYRDTIVISKSNWGYADIKVEVEGDFISGYKKHITTNDFAGSNYEYTYLIDKKRLHQGKNVGKITFLTGIEKHTLNIIVNEKTTYTIDTIEYQNYVDKLYRMYLDFRLKKIDASKWADMSLAIIDRMRAIKDDSYFYRLFQAQICISKGKEAESAWLLESVAESLIPKKDKNIEMYCYYLYVRTLQKRDTEFTEEVIKKVSEYFENGYDNWVLLWILLYLDDCYDNNLSLKLARIKEQYNKGMKSPLMYFEAMMAFNTTPELLRILNDFEIQVLCFASKIGHISEKLSNQIADVVMSTRFYNELLLKVLTTMYAENDNINVLVAIVTLLIKGNKTESKYFCWYDEAVRREIKLTGLYEYYMNSMPDDFDDEIPQIVLMYFSYNATISTDKLAKLYRQVIESKEENQYMYDAFVKQMSTYVAEAIEQGANNEDIAVVYRDILKTAMITHEMAEKLPEIVNTCVIKCDNDDIRRVIVIHKETKQIVSVPFTEGKAYVPLYSENPAIIFEDLYGNRYVKSFEYEVKHLLDGEDFLKICYEISAADIYLSLYFTDRFLRYHEDGDKSIGILQCISENENIRESYRDLLKKEIINFYSENFDGEKVDVFLDEINEDEVKAESLTQVIELFIIRGKYDVAYHYMEKYGYSYIDARRLLKCVNKLILDKDFERDELLIKLSAYVFENGKYNENILKYLCMYYYGSTSEMYNIWLRCDDYEIYDREMCEKLLAQMLFTRMYINKATKVFRMYNQLGAAPKIKKAFLFYKSYEYVIKKAIVGDEIFKYILDEISSDKILPELCKIAYLMHCADESEPTLESILLCKDLIYEMCKKDRMLGCFKKFEKYFKLPHNFVDKVFIEYMASSDSHVYIHYQLDTGGHEKHDYRVSEMDNMLSGIYSKSFVLFYGEKINYYISEELNGETKVTESKCLKRDDGLSSNNTRYGMINDMMICNDMKEEATLKDIAIQYEAIKELNSTIFTMMK